jgi:hypothetical protein
MNYFKKKKLKLLTFNIVATHAVSPLYQSQSRGRSVVLVGALYLTPLHLAVELEPLFNLTTEPSWYILRYSFLETRQHNNMDPETR